VNFSKKLITILGPTAVGKTKFATNLAYIFNGEIISADSRQVYIGMDIGTGKDYSDYLMNGIKIRSHLIDIIEPTQEFNLYLFTELFKKSFEEILTSDKVPFMVGGTGMYLSAILQHYALNEVDFNNERARQLSEFNIDQLQSHLLSLNPKLHNTTDTLNKDRIIKAILIAENPTETESELDDIVHLVIGLYEEREIVKEKIRNRLKFRLQNGMIEEAEKLLKSGITHEKLRFFGLEYKFLSFYLSGELNYNDLQQKLASSIIQFSKRQMTWFRKMEKEGVMINWLTNKEIGKAKELIKTFLEKDVSS
jgi:tRNA dimethylallyltransferase